MSWLLEILDGLDEDDVCHVFPERDIHVHQTGEEELQCWCCPEVERDQTGALLVIHNSESDRANLAGGILRPH